MRIFSLHLINTCLIEHLRNLMIEEISYQSSGVIRPSGSFRAICSHFVIVCSLLARAHTLYNFTAFEIQVGEGASALVLQ